MSRLTVFLVAALATLLASASVAAAAAPPDRYVLFVRDSPTPTQLDFGVGGGSSFSNDDGWAAAITFATRQGGRVTKTGDAMIIGTDGGGLPEVYAAGTRVTCHEVAPDRCNMVFGGSVTVMGTGGVVDDNLVIIGLHGDADAELGADSVGWHRVDLTAPLALVSAHKSMAAGTHVGPDGAEVFLSASAPTKNASSLAVAMPPCDLGAGAAVLTGGLTSPVHACSPAGWPGVSDTARAPTTWTATGAAAGVTTFSGRSRLAIFDLGAIEGAL